MTEHDIELDTQVSKPSEETTPEQSSKDLYAAIDLGSNSFHMIIARDVLGQMQVIDKHKEMVRLRSGLDSNGMLSAESFEAGIACLERFGQLIKHIPTEQVRAVGTNTLRNAKNSREFLKAARKAIGHEIQIIPGQEEARLIYLGVAHGLPQNAEQRLVMDIGGGSTEYIIGKDFSYDHLTSTEMGCVSVSELFFNNNEINQTNLDRAFNYCRQILRPHYRKLMRLGWDTTIGASGTIKSIGTILEENQWSKDGITLKGMQRLCEKLLEVGNIEAADIPGLKEERVPVLLGGLVILMVTFEELKIEIMQVSANALREGLIFDTLGRLHSEDAREISISALQQWMKVDIQQAKFIAETALCLYHQAHNTWQLHSPDYSYKKLLEWAAQIHEVGMALSYKRYRHHSAYIAENAELAGFSQQEKLMLAAMLLNHRGKFIPEVFDNLPKPQRLKLPFLTLLLRLAVRIHRGRENDQILPLIFIEQETHVHLEFENNWLDKHPLTRLDLNIEAERLALAGFTLTFK